LEPGNAVTSVATAAFTFGPRLTRERATALAERVLDISCLTIRTTEQNSRAALRTLSAAGAAGAGRAQAACPQTALLGLAPTRDQEGITFSALVNFGLPTPGCGFALLSLKKGPEAAVRLSAEAPPPSS
jgi:hypothetical protein